MTAEPTTPPDLELVAEQGPWGGPLFHYRGAEIRCLKGGHVCGLFMENHPLHGTTFGVPGTITPLVDLWIRERRLPDHMYPVPKPDGAQPMVTEAEARAALRAYVGVGHVEPWIAQQAWEATPSGWVVPVPLDGWIFRLEPAPGGVLVIASAGDGREPVAWPVPKREADQGQAAMVAQGAGPVTEAEARAVLRGFFAVGEIERWIAEQRWEPIPGGWRVRERLHAWRFRLEPVAGGVRIVMCGTGGQPAVWTVPAE